MKYLNIIILLAGSLLYAQSVPEENYVGEYDAEAFGTGESFARVTFADQYITILHEDNTKEDLLRNMPIVAGDLMKTRSNAYAEIEFIDGSLMQINGRSEVEFQAVNEPYGNETLSVIKLHRGGIFLHIVDNDHGAKRVFRVDSAEGTAYFEASGIYHVLMEGSRMKLKTFRGFAELSGELDSAPIYSGEYSTIINMRYPTRVGSFNSFSSTRFERWAYDRRPSGESVSSGYLDDDVAVYGRDLDDNGEWRYNSDVNNHVWVPRVSVGWRPYNNGYWTRRAGFLTWVSYDHFGWLTHHYGRWGFSIDFGWYWIPSRYYAPAWVAWSTYDSYVGWCPLGYWNRPYYYGYRNKVVINNYRWNYVNSSVIINRTRNYTYRDVAVRGQRHVSRGHIYVSNDDYRSGRGLTRVVRNPSVNRERAVVRQRRDGALVTTRSSTYGTRGQTDRVRIKSRDTGTVAVSRYQRNSTGRVTRATSTVSRDRTTVTRDNGRAAATRQSTTTTNRYGNRTQQSNGTSRRYGADGTNRSSSATRSSESRSRSTATRPAPKRPSSTTRSTPTNQRGSSVNRSGATRSNATRPGATRSSATRSGATRSNSSNRNRSSASRPAPQRQSGATRSNSSNRNRSSASRPAPKRQSGATRSNNSNRNRSSASRPAPKRQSSATRSNSSNRNRSSASRPAPKRQSSATRSSSNRSRSSASRSTTKRQSSATRSSSSRSSKSTTRNKRN